GGRSRYSAPIRPLIDRGGGGLPSQARQEHLAGSLFPRPRPSGAPAPLPFDPFKLHRLSLLFFYPPLLNPFFPATALAAALVLTAAQPAAARGPENIADVAEQVIDAVVNISTSQKIDPRVTELPDLPPGSPMEEFFDQFFKNRRGPGGNEQTPRR